MNAPMLRPALALLPLLLAVGCGSQDAVCDDVAAPSVYGTIVDQAGAAVAGAVVTYSVDGVDRGECSFTEGSAFVCGSEEAGEFEVTATLQGYYDVSAELTVYAGPCHVRSGQVVLHMVPRDCTDEEVPSVAVTLSTQSGVPLENPAVEYQLAGEDARTACSGSANDWTCGAETVGEFTVYANADGFAELTSTATVSLAEDECHVETVPVSIEFPDGG